MDPFDWINSRVHSLAIMLNVPPWIVLLTGMLLIVSLIGFSMMRRDKAALRTKVDFNRDPDELPDLSPQLRQARRQMVAAGLGMLALFALALFKLYEFITGTGQ